MGSTGRGVTSPLNENEPTVRRQRPVRPGRTLEPHHQHTLLQSTEIQTHQNVAKVILVDFTTTMHFVSFSFSYFARERFIAQLTSFLLKLWPFSVGATVWPWKKQWVIFLQEGFEQILFFISTTLYSWNCFPKKVLFSITFHKCNTSSVYVVWKVKGSCILLLRR